MWNPNVWIGRRFVCLYTGEHVIIPGDVRAGSFISFGGCFIDVGDGVTYRTGGVMLEITDLMEKKL